MKKNTTLPTPNKPGLKNYNNPAPVYDGKDAPKEEPNMPNNEIIPAQFVSIHLPHTLQKAYPNYQLYIDSNNIIRRSPDYIRETATSKKQYLFDSDNNIIYKESNLIQIVWINIKTNTYFITTYQPKETKKITDILPGSYGTSILQEYEETHDYLRDYLLRPLATQAPLDLNLPNNKLCEILRDEREHYTYQFYKITTHNGKYVNTYYKPVWIKADTAPEENPEEITE